MQQVPEAIYDIWDCWRARSSMTGIAMMPLAGIPPQRSIPIVLDGGIDYETILFVAGRRGAPPVIPAPTSQNSNRIFLGGFQFGGFPVVDVGAYQIYRVGGIYLWGILEPEGLLGDFMLGSAPMPNQPSYTTEYLPSANIRTGMVNDNPHQAIQHSTATGEELRRHINTDY